MNAPQVIPDVAQIADLSVLASRLFDELASCSDSGRGITRECFADGENRAMALVRDTALDFGLVCHFDRAGNLVVAMPDDDQTRPGLVLASHLDSVPEGGNFDGAAGVVAGLLCLVRLMKGKVEPPQPVRLIALRGEESAYYGRANIGSLALFGQLTTSDLDAKRRGNGRTLREALASIGADVLAIERGERLLPLSFASHYLELHIEQGPVMVARDLPTAIVTGIRGNLRHRRVICRGEAGHSGTVPRWLRKDALFAVADLVMRLDEHWNRLLERGLDLVVTTGICNTDPELQALSRIPGEVYFSFEVRSQSFETLEGFYELFRSECRAVSQLRGVTFEFDERIYSEPAKMDEAIVKRLSTAARQLDYPAELLPSGAGHDAAVFSNAGIPSGMIFVRNPNGSHNPREDMSMDDFLRGVELMYAFIMDGA